LANGKFPRQAPGARRRKNVMGGTVMATQDFDFEFSELTVLSRLASSGRHPNLLVVCNEDAKAFVAGQVAEWCQPPLHICRLPGPLSLSPEGASVVLSDVAKLTLSQQVELFDWMSRNPCTRVVSITSVDIPALINEGAFMEGLYYRLNTVRLDATEGQPVNRPRGLATNGKCLWI
jgi:hypothetical protein